MGSSHAASLKVIGTDMDRSDIYDFLLTFHGNHAPILYGFPDIAMYWPIIAMFFLNPHLFNDHADGVPLWIA